MEKQTKEQSAATLPADQGNAGDGGRPSDLRSGSTGSARVNEKILFIGGPLDGQRQNVPSNCSRHQYQANTWVNNAVAHHHYPIADMTMGVTTHTYDIKRLQDQNGQFQGVAVHSSVQNVIQQLIKGYRYHRKPRSRIPRKKPSWPNMYPPPPLLP